MRIAKSQAELELTKEIKTDSKWFLGYISKMRIREKIGLLSSEDGIEIKNHTTPQFSIRIMMINTGTYAG